MESERPNGAENAKHSNNEAFVRDKFCWYCHCQKKFRGFNCLKCFRSFHSRCFQRNSKMALSVNDEDDIFICPVCTSLDVKESVDKQTISELLKQTMAKVSADSEFKALNNLDGNNIANAIDLNEINRKIDNQVYDSFKAFLEDINTIVHNFLCINSNEQTRNMTYNLVKLCTFEVENMLSCVECCKNMHSKPNKWHSLACCRPHLVLWVLLNRNFTYWPAEKGYCYWPAKLVSVDRKNIKAIFFDYSEFVEIPRSNCFIYSTNELCTPWKSYQHMSNPKDMQNVLKEVKLYEQNIKAKFGRFESKLECVRFEKLEIHMRAMFPEYTGPLDAQNDYEPIEETNNTDKNDVIPKKRQCLSEEIKNGTDVTPNPIDAANINSNDREIDLEANSSESYSKPPNIELNLEEKLTEVMEDVSVEVLMRKHHDAINSKFQAKNQELETLKKSYANCQAKNNELVERLKFRDLADLNAKNEMAKIKEAHAKEIMALNETAAAEAKLKIEILQQEKEQEKEVLRKELQDNLDQKTIELKRHSALYTEQRSEFTKRIIKLKEVNIQKQKDHNTLMLNFEKKLEKNRENEEKRADDEVKKIQLDYSQKLAELQNKLKTAIEEKSDAEAQLDKNADLQAKYNSLVDQLKTVSDERDRAILNAKIEMDRTKAEHVKEMAATMSKIEKMDRNAGEMCKELKASQQKSIELETEKQRISNEMEKLKIDYSKKLSECRDSVATMKQNQLDMKKNYEKSILELKEEMKNDHKNELHKIHGHYKTGYKRVSDEMGKLKVEYDKKIEAACTRFMESSICMDQQAHQE